MIKEKYIKYVIGVERAYGDTSCDKIDALVMLIRDALEQEVARKNKVNVTKEEINMFKEHADKSSKAPEILQKVKEVFGSDTECYEKLYIIPKIINNKLRGYYSLNKDLHKIGRKQIELAFNLLNSGLSMKAVADSMNLRYLIYDYKSPEIPPILRNAVSSEFEDKFSKILDSLSIGEIYKNIIEDDNSFRIVKLLSKDKKSKKVEELVLDKIPFDNWYTNQINDISIRVYDKSLKREIKKRYSNVEWVRRIK